MKRGLQRVFGASKDVDSKDAIKAAIGAVEAPAEAEAAELPAGAHKGKKGLLKKVAKGVKAAWGSAKKGLGGCRGHSCMADCCSAY
jgi:hypothetical protein